MATVYACLVVRSHFLSEAGGDLAYSGVMIARANFCEILAMKLLSRFSSDKIRLVAVLTAAWSPLAGAPSHVLGEIRATIGEDDIDDDPQCALEVRKCLLPTLHSNMCTDGYCDRGQVFPVLATGPNCRE
jgi:hypothetical protein